MCAHAHLLLSMKQRLSFCSQMRALVIIIGVLALVVFEVQNVLSCPCQGNDCYCCEIYMGT